MQRIAIDMDDVLAATLPAMLDAYNVRYGDNLTLDSIWGDDVMDEAQPERRRRFEACLQSEELFRELEVVPDSPVVVRDLCDRYDVFITSAAMEIPASFAAKYEWLHKHFPFIQDSHIVFCGDKSIVQADYLIDDRPRHFERFGGQGIVFTAPHNVDEVRFPRVNNWREVARMFL